MHEVFYYLFSLTAQSTEQTNQVISTLIIIQEEIQYEQQTVWIL